MLKSEVHVINTINNVKHYLTTAWNNVPVSYIKTIYALSRVGNFIFRANGSDEKMLCSSSVSEDVG